MIKNYNKEETMEEKIMPRIDLTGYCKDKYIIDLGNYEIKEEKGVIYAVRKQSEYPNTYEECCDVLGLNNAEIKIKVLIHNIEHGEAELYRKFIELKRCRDAYWKIAGEQMGLGKPFEPDWNDENETYYTISYDGVNIKCYNNTDVYSKLAFPTREMRDAFYENFKSLIEVCKELL